jgi:hypothetical protein
VLESQAWRVELVDRLYGDPCADGIPCMENDGGYKNSMILEGHNAKGKDFYKGALTKEYSP